MNRIESVKISGKVLPDEQTDELIYSYITVSEDNDIDKTTSTIIEQGNDDTFYTNSNPKIPTLKHTFIKTSNYVSTQSIKLAQHNISKQIKDKSKQEIKHKILRQMSRRIVLNTPLENKPSNEEIRLSQRNSYFNKAKKIFQKFLCIGIDESGLDTIEDMDELMLMPKITFNYPNNFSEKDLEL